MRKVAILGKGPTGVLAPFADLSWEIWGLAWVTCPRETRTFDIHAPGTPWEDPAEAVLIGQQKELPVTGYLDGRYPNAIAYPFEEVFADVGAYMESSIAYMLGLAIHEKVPRIGLWGVHMETNREYQDQRANVEYLIGLARGRGLRVDVCPGAPLLSSVWVDGRYGLSNDRRF